MKDKSFSSPRKGQCLTILELILKNFILFSHFYIFSHVYTLVGPSFPHTPHTQLPGRTCSTSLFSWFLWRENINDNKKDIAYFLVWDKDSYVEKFLVLLPCTCVFQPKLVHLYQNSSLLPSPLPVDHFICPSMVSTSTTFKF
jgi:hypothetical protein